MMMFCASSASGEVELLRTLTRFETSWLVKPGSTNVLPLPLDAGGAEYANCEAGTMAELPEGVVTLMFAVPLPGGLVATMTVSPSTAMPVADAPPKSTAVAPVKPDPWIVTAVPPPVGPLLGLMLVIAGSAIAFS
jgi:hypothetical protein